MYFISLCFGLFLLVCSSSEAVVLDRIVAVVNDDTITLSELKSLELSFLQNSETRPGESELRLHRSRLLDDLIEKTIKLQKAKELNITVSGEEVEASIQQILTTNRITEEDLKAKLKGEGFSWPDYQKEIREQMILSRLVNQEVRSKIILMPEELKEFYEKHLDRFVLNEKKHLLRILLAIPETATEEEVQSRREESVELRQRLLSGEEFRQLAIRYSNGPEAGSGGDLGYFASRELKAELVEEVSQLGPGGISRVMELKEGFVLIKIEDVRETTYIPLEEVKEPVQEALYQEKLQKRYEVWIKELRDRAYVERKL
jgi:peptidyl-prolyl cis-trans isomerase SurA